MHEESAGQVQVGRGNYRYEGGFAAALELFAGPTKPQALFCANDLLAIGAIDALKTRLGIRVPEDVLVAGFDDIPAAGWASVNLTTFVQDAAAMVEVTLGILPSAHIGKPPAAEPIVVSARLVERGTTLNASGVRTGHGPA